MRDLKDKNREEFRIFWKSPDITDITKLYLGMEFDTFSDYNRNDDENSLINFYRSKFLPLLNTEESEDSDLSELDIHKVLKYNKRKIAFYFHPFNIKSILVLAVIISLIFVIDIIMQLNIISFFFSEESRFTAIILILAFFGIFYPLIRYSSDKIGERDVFIKKAQQIHNIIEILALLFFLSIYSYFLTINTTRGLSNLDYRNFFLWTLNLLFILVILSFPIYLIDKEKTSQYYIIRFLNFTKNCNELNEKYIMFYFRKFLISINQSLKKSTDLVIANLIEVENSFYKNYFLGKMEGIDELANNLEKILLDKNNFNRLKLKYSALKEIFNTLNKFLKKLKNPEISFKKHSLIERIAENYKKISVIVVTILALFNPIMSILNLILN